MSSDTSFLTPLLWPMAGGGSKGNEERATTVASAAEGTTSETLTGAQARRQRKNVGWRAWAWARARTAAKATSSERREARTMSHSRIDTR
eukprot:scaffold159633_cov32-Tisochrysis_lutea.AAC.3